VLRVNKVLEVFKEKLDHKVLKVFKVFKDFRENVDLKVIREILEMVLRYMQNIEL